MIIDIETIFSPQDFFTYDWISMIGEIGGWTGILLGLR